MIRYFFLLVLLNITIMCYQNPRIFNYFHGTQIKQITGFKDEIWFGSYGKGLLILNKNTEKWNQINSSNSGLKNDMVECFAVSDDYIWVGSAEGLWICERANKKWIQKRFPTGGVYGQWVRTLLYDSLNKTLWVGRFANLTCFSVSSGKWNEFDLAKNKDAQTNNFKSLWISEGKLLWAGAESGVHKLSAINPEAAVPEYYDSKVKGFCNSSQFNSVNSIKSRENKVFFGLQEFVTQDKPNYNLGGIYYFDQNSKWESLTKKDGIISNGIYAIEFVGNYLVAGTYEFIPSSKNEKGMGISIYNLTNKKVYNLRGKESGLLNDKVFSIYFDGKYLWLGTLSGISRISFENDFLVVKK